MLNITTIETTIRAWIATITAREVIFTHPTVMLAGGTGMAPLRPSVPYVLVHLMITTPQGVAEHIDAAGANDTVDVDYSNLEEVVFSINVMRDDAVATAFTEATKIKDSLDRITIVEQLYTGGLGVIRAEAVKDVTIEIDKPWEPRAQFDCSFYTRSLDEENIEQIKKIQLINKVEGDMVWNGGFDSDTYWIKGVGWTIANGVASCDGSQITNSAIDIAIGLSTIPTLYKVTWDLVTISAGNITPRIRQSGEIGVIRTLPGSYIDYITSYSGTNGNLGIRGTTAFIGAIDNVTCERVTEIE